MDLESYANLLKTCPPSESPDFIEFIRENNQVVFENKWWLCIENAKYFTKEHPHLTLFSKQYCTDTGDMSPAGWRSLKLILTKYPDWMFYTNCSSQKSIKRYHAHLIRDFTYWLLSQNHGPQTVKEQILQERHLSVL